MKMNSSSITVVPWDFSNLSRRALDRAVQITSDPSLIRVVHVADLPTAYDYAAIWGTFKQDTLADRAEDSFRKFVADDDQLKDVKFVTLFGDAGHEICDFAKEFDAHLIVMPSHGRTGLKRILLGSVAERVVRFAPCSVLVLRDLLDEEDFES